MDELKDTLKLLRFPFSIFLLPVSLFSMLYILPENSGRFLLILVIWHLLVYPSSNGYNSYNDRDEGPIGGLEAPPQPGELLFYLTGFMDIAAIIVSFFISPLFASFVAIYIAVSRLYSNRRIRLKKFPLTGFLCVFVFQGAWVFCANVISLNPEVIIQNSSVVFAALACSFFIATIYPLTQVYQHEADAKDGVRTLSMLLGTKGTFIFSALMFAVSNLLVYLAFRDKEFMNFLLFNVAMLPSALYFIYWAWASFRNPARVNFKNAMTMLTLASLSNNLFFLVTLLK